MPLIAETKYSELVQRINLLTPQSKRRWGKMSIEEMLTHCTAGIEMAIGDIPSKKRVGPVRAAIIKVLFLELFPFPKSAPTAAELHVRKKLKVTRDFNDARNHLIGVLTKAQNLPADFTFMIHPIFHQLSYRQWGKLAYKHLNHHLKQFGV